MNLLRRRTLETLLLVVALVAAARVEVCAQNVDQDASSAGTGFASPQSDINASWASGWGVRLLEKLVAETCEP